MKVSILIPCFNAERWVGEAIRSALGQTWGDKEVIVVDDGSTDGSLEVIRAFGDAIRWETGPNRGGNAARNRLLELARGEWLQYLDADDWLMPEKVERQVEEMGEAGRVDVAYSPVVMEYWSDGVMERRAELEIEEGRGVRDPSALAHASGYKGHASGYTGHDVWEELIRWQLPQTGAALWRKSAIEDVGGWKADQPCCQEHELYLRLLKGGKRFVYCPTAGAVYRQWSTGTVCRKDPLKSLVKRLEVVDACEEHLERVGELTESRRDAIAHARLECARGVYQHNRDEGRRVARLAKARHGEFELPAAAAFPRGYRWAYRVAGFEGAERLAGATRRWRR